MKWTDEPREAEQEVLDRLAAGEDEFDISIEKWESICNAQPIPDGPRESLLREHYALKHFAGSATNCAMCVKYKLACGRCPLTIFASACCVMDGSIFHEALDELRVHGHALDGGACHRMYAMIRQCKVTRDMLIAESTRRAEKESAG